MSVLKAQPQQRISNIIYLPVCQLPVRVYWVLDNNSGLAPYIRGDS